MMRRLYFGLVLVSLALSAPREASAQGKTFKGGNYAITFAQPGWDTVQSANILSKITAFAVATLGATPATSLPNVDSLTASLSDSLGGKVTKDSSGVKTLGKYQVHWQKYTYDSLPKLSAMIAAASPFPISPLKNGSFRVYYLYADGFAFSIASMSVIPSGIPPYGEIETAIATLKLGSQAGIFNQARSSGRELWVRQGRLGGAWLGVHKPLAVEGFDSRGALVGSATAASDGSWILPVSGANPSFLLVRVRTADGLSALLPVRP